MVEYFDNHLITKDGFLSKAGRGLESSGIAVDAVTNFIPGHDAVAGMMIGAGSVMQAADAAIDGNGARAGKLVIKGTVEAGVALFNGVTLGLANLGSKVFTGKTLIGHAGGMTASLLDLDGDIRRDTLRAHMGAVGGSGTFMAAQPQNTYWQNYVGAQRQQNQPQISLPPAEAQAWAAKVEQARQAAARQAQMGGQPATV